MTGKILNALPNEGTLFAYGGLGSRVCNDINLMDLIYHNKKVEGWLLTSWVLEHGKGLRTLMRINEGTSVVHQGLLNNNGWSVSTFNDCKLNDMWENFKDMKTNTGFTNRKLRIMFDQQ